MFTSSKEYLNLYFEDKKSNDRSTRLNESAISEQAENKNNDLQSIYEQQSLNAKKFAKAGQIRHEVKKALLFECIYKVYKESLTVVNTDKNVNESIAKSFVNEFIEENGVDTLLSSFKSKSFVLSEFSRIVSKYTDIVCEKSNCENPDNFSICPEDKANFYDELDMDDIEDVSQMIKTRVSSTIEDFVSDNINAKAEIKEIIQQSQEKIAGEQNEELKEHYEIQAKKKITNIRECKSKSIFESIVFRLAKSVVVNEEMKDMYMKDNRLNMERVVETAEIIHTFLETVNTCKMLNVDEEYIGTILKGI